MFVERCNERMQRDRLTSNFKGYHWSVLKFYRAVYRRTSTLIDRVHLIEFRTNSNPKLLNRNWLFTLHRLTWISLFHSKAALLKPNRVTGGMRAARLPGYHSIRILFYKQCTTRLLFPKSKSGCRAPFRY